MWFVDYATSSQIFSRDGIQLVARWQFCRTTHVPSAIALSIIFAAIGPLKKEHQKVGLVSKGLNNSTLKSNVRNYVFSEEPDHETLMTEIIEHCHYPHNYATQALHKLYCSAMYCIVFHCIVLYHIVFYSFGMGLS